jgi:carbonic anhydrase
MITHGSFRGLWVLATIAAVAGGCATHTPAPIPAAISETFDKSRQSATTPDEAIARLKDGNLRFTSGTSMQRDYVAQRTATSSGQYPFAAVLSCMDSRSTPEIVFDQGIGDLFVVRVAGNFAPTEIIGSLEYATKVAGAKLIVVMGHTECGAIKGACDNVQLGNLTTVIDALRLAVDDVQNTPGDHTSKNKAFVYAVTIASVRRTVTHIRAASPILHELEDSGNLKIIGAVQDIATGRVTFFDWTPPS